MKRILFVDDEPYILDGLRDLFWRYRRQMETVFVTSGEAAMDELRKSHFDVIVSDMRMPGMDGATLLQKVKEEYPDMVRIILSGHAELEAIFRSLPVAHQFLGKPCDAGRLCDVIERVCRLQALLSDESIRKAICNIEKLPPLPKLYHQLVKATSQPEPSEKAIARIMGQDPAMSAKVLQLVNSACFGPTKSITSVEQAVSYLGVHIIKHLVLSVHVFDAVVDVPGFSFEQLHGRALLTARVVSRLMPTPQEAHEAFAAALLQDIGYMVLALCLREPFGEIILASDCTTKPMYEVEREFLGVTHAEVGAYLLGLWGLPYNIVEGVAYHHDPAAIAGRGFDVPTALQVAAILVDKGIEEATTTDHTVECVELFRTLGLGGELGKWSEVAAEEVGRWRAET